MIATLEPKISEPKTFRYIGRCPVKGCSCTVRVNVPGKFETRYTRGFIGTPGSAQKYQVSVPQWAPYNLMIHCIAHKRQIGWREISGVLNPLHKCDPRCTGARGHNCECSCGGENHGADWLI